MSKIERSILEFLHDILEFATGLQRNIASISKEKISFKMKWLLIMLKEILKR